MDIAKYLDDMTAKAAAAKREEEAKPYIFMLPITLGGGFVIESRYATGIELDTAVEEFAAEFRDDHDGYAPESGKDFLAVKVESYSLTSDPTEPDWDQIAAERREAAAL